MSEQVVMLYGSQPKAMHDRIIEEREGLKLLGHHGLNVAIAYTRAPHDGTIRTDSIIRTQIGICS